MVLIALVFHFVFLSKEVIVLMLPNLFRVMGIGACINFLLLALSFTGRTWYGMENGMKRKFRHGIWKMPELNGRFQG